MSSVEVIYGIHVVESIIAARSARIISLQVSEAKKNPRIQAVVASVEALQKPIEWVSADELTKRCGTNKHQGIAIQVSKRLEQTDLMQIVKVQPDCLLLILDGVQDPHNLGACLRTADAAGVHAVIVPKDNASKINATVCKVASGAAETVPFFEVTNLARTMKSLQDAGVWIVGSADDATDSLYDMKLTGPIAMVMGSEGKGLRRLTRENCDFLCHIPMQGYVSSLNVSVATAVMLYEVVRQRG